LSSTPSGATPEVAGSADREPLSRTHPP
jgi:hypothetical protein